jgi:hypothetical protein
MTRAISIPLFALSLIAGCGAVDDPDRHRVGASTQDGSPIKDVTADAGPCEPRPEYTAEDVVWLDIDQCTYEEKWLVVVAAFPDTCENSVGWSAVFSNDEADVVPGTYQIQFRENPVWVRARIGTSDRPDYRCYWATGGTAVLIELVDYELASGSFEDVTMAEVPCDPLVDPPEDLPTRFRVSFPFEGRPIETCPTH